MEQGASEERVRELERQLHDALLEALSLRSRLKGRRSRAAGSEDEEEQEEEKEGREATNAAHAGKRGETAEVAAEAGVLCARVHALEADLIEAKRSCRTASLPLRMTQGREEKWVYTTVYRPSHTLLSYSIQIFSYIAS